MSTVLAQHILLAIDGSPGALAACTQAAHMARAFGAAVTIVHVAVPRLPRNPMSPAEALRVTTEAESGGHLLLAAAQALVAPLAPCRTALHFGVPAEVICDLATELSADLVVVGSRGLGRLDRLLLGSVSTSVVQRAPCPVLVVR